MYYKHSTENVMHSRYTKCRIPEQNVLICKRRGLALYIHITHTVARAITHTHTHIPDLCEICGTAMLSIGSQFEQKKNAIVNTKKIVCV